jgi:hypothetical protein
MKSIHRGWNTSAPSQCENVVLYGQHILNRKLVRHRRGSMKVALSGTSARSRRLSSLWTITERIRFDRLLG